MPFTSYVENIFITQSLPKIMKDAGYLSEVYPMVPMSVYLDEQVVDNVRTSSRRDKYEYSDIVTLATLVDLTVFRHGFMPIKYMTAHHPGLMLQNHVRKIVPANRAAIRPVYRDIAFIDEMEQGASNTRSVPVFKFYHLNGVHSPLTLNENLGYEAMTESRANHKRQSVASLKIVNRFLSKLKEIGVYDNAMIVITADHGFGPIGIHNPDAGFPIKNPDYYKTDAYMGAALPLLLIKPPNTHGTLTVNDVPTMLTDIPLTVAETIGVSNPFGGLNALEMSDDSGRRRPFYWFDWKWIRSNDYLPPIKEYIIQGDNWLSSSWSLSGRTLEKNKTIESPIIPYDLGEKVTFGQKSIGEVYQELGWSKSYSDYVYSKYKYASLVFPITKVDGDLELEIELEPFLAKGAVNSQRVGISVNKEPLKKFELTEPGVQNIKVVIPKRLVDDNILRIAFELPDAARPIDYDMGKDTRTLAIMLRSVVINKLME